MTDKEFHADWDDESPTAGPTIYNVCWVSGNDDIEVFAFSNMSAALAKAQIVVDDISQDQGWSDEETFFAPNECYWKSPHGFDLVWLVAAELMDH